MPALSWNKIKEFEFFSPVTHSTPARSPDVQARYEAHRAQLRAEGISLADHIKATVFKNSTSPAVVTENTFPYDVEPGIQHLLLWSNPAVTRSLGQTLPPPYNTIPADRIALVRNSKQSQSVPELPHVHLFVRTLPPA